MRPSTGISGRPKTQTVGLATPDTGTVYKLLGLTAVSVQECSPYIILCISSL